MVYIADAEAMAEDHEGLRGSIDEKKADSHSFVAAQVADSFTLWWEPFEAMYTLDKPTDDGTLVFVLTEEGGDLVRDGDATLYRQQAIDDPYVPVEEE